MSKKINKGKIEKELEREFNKYYAKEKEFNRIQLKASKYPSLTSKQIDYAIRSALVYDTDIAWMKKLNINATRYYEWKKDPQIIAFQKDISYDYNAFVINTMKVIHKGALMQYIEIFDAKMTSENMSVKRQAAKDILGFLHGNVEKENVNKFNINIIQDKKKEKDILHIENTSEKILELESKLEELNQLEKHSSKEIVIDPAMIERDD